MAMYEYHCDECETDFTVSQPISEHEKRKKKACPECGSRKTRQRFSSFFAKTSSKA